MLELDKDELLSVLKGEFDIPVTANMYVRFYFDGVGFPADITKDNPLIVTWTITEEQEA